MSGTALLYLEDAYAREFESTVVETEEHAVILESTLFYPRGGGQMADTGRLLAYGSEYGVIAVEKRGDVVHHTVDGVLPQVGTRVRGTIDWDHRYQMMRTHTALHVLCGVIWKQYGSVVTGCQMYPNRARMDFSLADLSASRVQEIERLSNEVISAGYPVKVHFMPRREADLRPELIRTKISLVPQHIDPIRTVEIVGHDLQADGGTHVANTIEIGSITITKTENKGRENRRIEIQLAPALG